MRACVRVCESALVGDNANELMNKWMSEWMCEWKDDSVYEWVSEWESKIKHDRDKSVNVHW